MKRVIEAALRPPRCAAVPPKHERPRCGARCRDGHACLAPVFKRPDGQLSRRCRLHGGASTGPKTAEGRRRALEALREGNRRWRERLANGG
ncbi:HGGxSTG domain-containing protein [Zeimonas sediminis]|uniref:HGGxSTG domain-containing protein n=1 Tax=Zeimonas sediminis TaxID=2944268 RepID=UPI003AF054C4